MVALSDYADYVVEMALENGLDVVEHQYRISSSLCNRWPQSLGNIIAAAALAAKARGLSKRGVKRDVLKTMKALG